MVEASCKTGIVDSCREVASVMVEVVVEASEGQNLVENGGLVGI